MKSAQASSKSGKQTSQKQSGHSRVRVVDGNYQRQLIEDLGRYASAMASPVDSSPERMPELAAYDSHSIAKKYQSTYPLYSDDSGRAAAVFAAHPTSGVYLTPVGTTAGTYVQGERGLLPVAPGGVGPYGLPCGGAAPPYQISRPGYMLYSTNGAGNRASQPYGDINSLLGDIASASAMRVTAFGARFTAPVNAALQVQGARVVAYDKSPMVHPDASNFLIVPAGGGVAYGNEHVVNFTNASNRVGADPVAVAEGSFDCFALPISGEADWHPTTATGYLSPVPLGADSRVVDFQASSTDTEQTVYLSRLIGGLTGGEFVQLQRASHGAWETITVVFEGCEPSKHICDVNVAMHIEFQPLTKAITYPSGVYGGRLPLANSMPVVKEAAASVRDSSSSGKWIQRIKKLANFGMSVGELFAPGAASKAMTLARQLLLR